MATQHTIAADLQDVLHYFGSLAHYYEVATPYDEYAFEGETETLRQRVEMYERAVTKWTEVDSDACDLGLVARDDEPRPYEAKTEPVENETQMRDRVCSALGSVLALATACGVDAHRGMVVR